MQNMTALEADKWLESVRVVKSNFKVRVGQRMVFVKESKAMHEDGRYRMSYDVLDGEVVERVMVNWDTSYRVRLTEGAVVKVERWHVIEVC